MKQFFVVPMIKKIILVLIAITFLKCANTTKSDLYQVYDKESYVYWSENKKLTWQDFQGKLPDSKSSYVSQIRIYNPATIERTNYFSEAVLTSICVFDKKNSWVKKSAVNDSLLLYNQVLFDIYELYSRILKSQFEKTEFSLDNYKEEFKSLTEKINADLEKRIKLFKEDTDYGNNYAGIKVWEINVHKELNELGSFKTD